MDNRQLKKSKLVTYCRCCPDNDGFSHLYPDFKYDGCSRSEKSKVYMTFPAYPENLMFYEHFDQVNNLFPSRLSFMYLGGNDQGEVQHEFAEYKSVSVMDVCKKFATVKSLFHVVSKLSNCVELRIFLSAENIFPTKEEAEMMKLSDKEMPPYISKSVKKLRITQQGDVDSTILNKTSETRLDYFLLYAFQLFPNLEAFVVDGLSGKGKTYDLIHEFVKKKPFLPVHNVTLRHDGKTTCQRVGVCHRQLTAPPRVSYTNPFASQEITSNKKVDIQKYDIAFTAIAPANPGSPQLSGMKRKCEDLPTSVIKQEKENKDKADKTGEVPVPLKQTDPATHNNIADEDESTSNSPKKAKNESPVAEATTATLPSRPHSNASKTSTRSPGSSSVVPPVSATRENTSSKSNSPSIGSPAQEWETSSSEDEKTQTENNEKIQGFAVNPQVSADQLTAIASQITISAIDLRNVLNLVQSESPSSVVEPEKSVPSESAAGSVTEESNYITVKKGRFEFERIKRKW